MTVRATSTNANYLNAYSMYQDLYAKNTKTSDSNTAIAGNYTTSGTQATSGLLTAQGRDELSKALDAMKKAGYTRFTFNDVEDYRKNLESEFSKTVKADLKEMGVDPDITFNLVLDANGNLKVISDHADKAAVEAYFEDNPEMVDVFKHIQALSNLKKAQSRAPDQAAEFTRNMKLSLQAEAVQAFFAATDNNGADYFSQIATFGSNDATSFLLGLNQSV
ncbi:conserved hypothetical protein [uncultured delta proteobacterium]|uniref:Uncharacterized protein n=1 Tax=uncultured delta proteobacterium TaxID=34034 RepID=A0A212KDG2_9DELT|nr:conserved hypothetical protein [uncultured delta proteobacterium]